MIAKVLFFCLFLVGVVDTMLYYFYCFVLINTFFISSVSATDCLTNKQQLQHVKEWAMVAKVIDGDTVHLKDGRKIRFLGINTPEIGRRGEASQPFAKKAYITLKKLLETNKKIGLSYDKVHRDHYKRVLAYISFPDGRSAQQILLAKGLAYSIVVPPNDVRIACYRDIEQQARESSQGIWKMPERQWISAELLSAKAKGQRFITGTISAYSESRKSIYLKLTNKLSIRISKKDKPYFSNINFKQLIGKPVKVRGWVSTYKRRQSIAIRTAHDLQL